MYKPFPQSIRLGRSREYSYSYGLFANVDLPKDTILGITHIYHSLFPDGWIRTPLGGFYNHSETPNCKLVANRMSESFPSEEKDKEASKRFSFGKNVKLGDMWVDEEFLTQIFREIKLLQTIEYINVGTELTCTYTIERGV